MSGFVFRNLTASAVAATLATGGAFAATAPATGTPASAASATAGPGAKAVEVPVSLFGQPCLLSGPFTADFLKSVHAVSPEQVPPPQDAARAKEAAEKIRQLKSLPAQLDRYREKLLRYLDASAAFHEGLAAARKTGKRERFMAAVASHLNPERAKAFRSKFAAIKGAPASWDEAKVEELSEAFFKASEPAPEEEFHRTIAKMGIRYLCDFGDGEGEGDGGDEE